jgi:hypothetical protein
VNKVSPYAKAIVGFVGAGLVAFLGAQDGGVTGQEWIQILIAALAGSGLVYAVPNKDPKALHQDESVQPPNQRGESALYLICVVIALILLVWLVVSLVHR